MPLEFTKITDIPLGPVSLKVWGMMVATGMLVGLWVALKEAKRKKIDRDIILDAFVWLVIASMLGGRLLYVFLFWDHFSGDPIRILKLWEGGMVFYGGIFAALLAIWFYLNLKKVSFWKVMDVMAPGFALGTFFGRIGCYLIGDHIGAVMKHDWFWGSVLSGDDQLRHEPSLYLSINGLIIFLILWSIRKKKRFKTNGQLVAVFFGLYGFTRFFLDFFRATDVVGLSDPRYFGLTISQVISVILFIFAVAALKYPQILSSKKSRR